MSEFIQFGWDAIGFLFGVFVVLFIAGVLWSVFAGFFDWLVDIVEQNGWDK